MTRDHLNEVFDLGDDMFGGYFSNTEINDIDEKYIGSVIDLYSLTKVTRQLVLSMGEMMKLVCGFAILIFVILVYLLSKIIIEKNAQSISMTKILGYSRGEIARLYILPTSIMVVLTILAEIFTLLIHTFRFSFLSAALYIFAEIAVFCVALELLIDRFCSRPLYLGWSAIVLTVCSVIVIALIAMLSMQRLRDAVRRRLHF